MASKHLLQFHGTLSRNRHRIPSSLRFFSDITPRPVSSIIDPSFTPLTSSSHSDINTSTNINAKNPSSAESCESNTSTKINAKNSSSSLSSSLKETELAKSAAVAESCESNASTKINCKNASSSFSSSLTETELTVAETCDSNKSTKINGKNVSSSFSSSLNETELAKFAAIAESWWDAAGPFKPLHVMNPTRLAFIRSTLCRHFGKDPYSPRPFEGLRIADVGCGGGILSEPLARMGAMVTGIDAVEKNVTIARLHAELDPATSSIEYCCTTAEKLVEEGREFDVVISLEVIEHVAEPAEFCKSLSALTVPGGANVISTINRSMRAYATAIIAAEYILHWLPKGTHQWSNFLTPEELVLILQRASINIQEMAGFEFNPLTGRWVLCDDIGVNFIAFGTKNSQ